MTAPDTTTKQQSRGVEPPATAQELSPSGFTAPTLDRRSMMRSIAAAAVMAVTSTTIEDLPAQDAKKVEAFDPNKVDLAALDQATSAQQMRGYFRFQLMEPLLRDLKIKEFAELVDRARSTSTKEEVDRLGKVLEERYPGIDPNKLQYSGQVGAGATDIKITSNGREWREKNPDLVAQLLLRESYADLRSYEKNLDSRGEHLPDGFAAAIVDKFRLAVSIQESRESLK
jgi:hypothetical protein